MMVSTEKLLLIFKKIVVVSFYLFYCMANFNTKRYSYLIGKNKIGK